VEPRRRYGFWGYPREGMDDYRPVDCATYCRYELAILRRQPLMLRWRDDAGIVHLGVVLPRDLRTSRGVEYLEAEDSDGRPLCLRLDAIAASRPALSASSRDNTAR